MDLDAAVVSARGEYSDRRLLSRSWHERANTVMPGANTRSALYFEPFPFRVERAEGRLLFDVDGHRYVDLLGNYTAGLLGHSPDAVQTAAVNAIERGWSFGSVNSDEVLLAESIVSRFASIERVRFTNSGTEANLMALAVATHHTGRSRIVVFRGGYHGGVLTFGERPRPVDVPHEWLLCDYNDSESVATAFAEHGDEIAAVLVEPMQGSSGCIPADPDFLVDLHDLCHDAGAVLVFDEVMTSRFSIGGAQQLWGVSPDLTTLGKYLAGGFGFGAFGGAAEVMAHFDPAQGGELGHAGTFNNNVVSMAAGVAASEVLTADVLDATHARGERLREALDEVLRTNHRPMCVTGTGSLMNVHGVAGPVKSSADLADADERWRELFFFHCLDAGWYIARRGFIALSIEITDADIDEFIDVAAEFAP